jgi:hypothetical protein
MVNDNPSPDYRATSLYADDTELLAAPSQSGASLWIPGVVYHQIWALAVELDDCYQCLERHGCAFCWGRETHPKAQVSPTLWTADTVAIRGSGACETLAVRVNYWVFTVGPMKARQLHKCIYVSQYIEHHSNIFETSLIYMYIYIYLLFIYKNLRERSFRT